MESAGDRVLLQPKPRDPFLSKILRPDGRTSTQHGELMHANIIGKRTRDTVMSSRGTELRVFLPTLADYVTLTPRNVTPVSRLVLVCIWAQVDPYTSRSILRMRI